MRHFLGFSELSSKELLNLLERAIEIKKNPKKFSKRLLQKNMLMLFEQPSVRTRLSFETGLTQLGGHAIYYDIKESTLGKKETIGDYAKTVSRYVDVIGARLNNHEQIVQLSKNSDVPVINMMSNFEHPCQGLADFLTILEHKKKLKGLKLAYVGDANNNVTNTLLFGGALLGMDISVGCPDNTELMTNPTIVEQVQKTAKKNNAKINLFHSAKEAVRNADVVYTDSWMSYRIPEEAAAGRINQLHPFQVNSQLMKHAKKDAIFLHCLPASRGHEVTDEVMDSKQSAVFDQAENRLHCQKALLLELFKKNR
ncbi:MAG: ornithine carbamoyltransferase [Candidatus Micrarchaeota archaeon]